MALPPKVLAVRLNLPDVDQAFPRFFEALSLFQGAMARHEEVPEIRSFLQDVVVQAIAIFRREEEAMEITRDRMILSHRAAHKKFLHALQRIRKDLDGAGPSIGLAQDVRRDVVDWMSDHHLLMDAALGNRIQAVVEQSLARMSAA